MVNMVSGLLQGLKSMAMPDCNDHGWAQLYKLQEIILNTEET